MNGLDKTNTGENAMRFQSKDPTDTIDHCDADPFPNWNIPPQGAWLRPGEPEDDGGLADAVFDAIYRSEVPLSLVMAEIAEQATPGEIESIRRAFADEQAIADRLDAELAAAGSEAAELSVGDVVAEHPTPRELERICAAMTRRIAAGLEALLEVAQKQAIAKRAGCFVTHQEVSRILGGR
jgi:hypothetical protein